MATMSHVTLAKFPLGAHFPRVSAVLPGRVLGFPGWFLLPCLGGPSTIMFA